MNTRDIKWQWTIELFRHLYGFGVAIDRTTWTNIVFQGLAWSGVYSFSKCIGFCGPVESASLSVVVTWLFLELHSAWQREYGEANMFDFLEFATACSVAVVGYLL